jgi:glycosyltransferase involved in cell wall biosynthesis
MDYEFLVIAKWLQGWLRDNFGKSADYVPNAVSEKLFYPDKPLKPKGKRLRVLLEGPIDVPFKGMQDAFAAVKGLDCEVWCVSSLGRPKLGWKCDRFFHRVPFGEMRRIYSSCDVLLKMSRVEGFGLPPLEMMACGGAVVAGKVTGYDEYIVDGHNALVVEQGDVAEARGCLQRLIDDRDLLEELKARGRETAAKWRWEHSAEALCQVLQRGSPQTTASGPGQATRDQRVVPKTKHAA